MMTWKNILCDSRELQLVGTLNGGQSFRWSLNESTGEWLGVFGKTAWKLRQASDCLQYKVLGSLVQDDRKYQVTDGKDVFEKMLRDYFRLDIKLNEHFKAWAEKDKVFQSACQQFYGIRMLQQEPVENLFSFICSQNNHISRISSMVERLCSNYGEKICEFEDVSYYSFPDVETLAKPEVEVELRNLSFGYRAKFIHKSAEQIVEWGKDDWFKQLENMKYKEAREELMKLHGIGPKVADCICLMSLNHLESIPVDTHVHQIAANYYLPHLKKKNNITKQMYIEIGDSFRDLFGSLAGWAQTVLFCSDLKKFQEPATKAIKDKPAKVTKKKLNEKVDKKKSPKKSKCKR